MILTILLALTLTFFVLVLPIYNYGKSVGINKERDYWYTRTANIINTYHDRCDAKMHHCNSAAIVVSDLRILLETHRYFD